MASGLDLENILIPVRSKNCLAYNALNYPKMEYGYRWSMFTCGSRESRNNYAGALTH